MTGVRRLGSPDCVASPAPRSAAAFLVWLLLAMVPALATADGRTRAGTEPPRQLALSIEAGRLLASNVRLSRIDPLSLGPDEKLVQTAVANAVIIAVTSQRVLGYGPVVGWRELPLESGEELLALEAQGYAAFITTRLRLVNFNADSGVWAESSRTQP